MPEEKQVKETVSKGTKDAETKPEKPSIHKKLLKVQSGLKAPKGQYNSFGKYHYRSCEDVLEAAKPLLEANGLAIILRDEIEEHPPRFYIKATVTITDVETGDTLTNIAYAREEDDKKGMDGSQVTGASSSYARKYALNGLFAIDDNKDSDATNEGDEKKKGDSKTPKKDDKPNEPLAKAIQEVVAMGSKVKTAGHPVETIYDIVSKHNNGNKSPAKITTVEACTAIMKAFNELLAKSPTPPTEEKTTKTEINKENN